MQEQHAPSAAAMAHRKYGVLVADDEPDIRAVLHEGLEREGFAVWVAGDGDEAVALYRGHRRNIDVVLLDVCMPTLDGPAALKAIQALKPAIPCCFMSGYLGEHTAEALRRRGAQAIVTKPFEVVELAQTLRTLAQSARPRRRPPKR